ncbi:MAG: hypothetical protein LBQ24_06400 [Candidatus Peribacteria bacterium]|jgi:hypothetical protein|nr:hypothetical protein [Candidatus Peribacteria bacterium]
MRKQIGVIIEVCVDINVIVDLLGSDEFVYHIELKNGLFLELIIGLYLRELLL